MLCCELSAPLQQEDQVGQLPLGFHSDAIG